MICGHSHLSLKLFLMWWITWLIGWLDQLRLAYFTMKNKLRLLMAHNHFSSLVGPDQELVLRALQRVLIFSLVLIWPAMERVGSHFKVRKDNISSLVAEYLDRGFMRW
jgi:hypothetical protein